MYIEKLCTYIYTIFFLNEPHKIVRVSIEILETYKGYNPGSHRQEKQKKRKTTYTRLVRLGYQYG
jgi:hypothetical protein